MKNKDIETKLKELYIKGWITKDEYLEQMDKLDKREKPDLPEPPPVY